MKKALHYIGLDVHADSITIVIAEQGRDGEVRPYGKIANDLHVLDKVLARLGHPEVELRVCYETGPCGFATPCNEQNRLAGQITENTTRKRKKGLREKLAQKAFPTSLVSLAGDIERRSHRSANATSTEFARPTLA